MHVVVVARSFEPTDGTGSINYSTVVRALERGHRVTTISQDSTCPLSEHPQLTHVALRLAKIPTDVLQSIVFARLAAIWIARHRATIDVLHVNGSSTLVPADINSSHFVFTRWLESEEWQHIKPSPRSLYQRFYARFNSWTERIAYARAKTVVAISDRIRDELISVGVDASRIVVIENGIDTERFQARTPDRTRFGLPEGVPMLAFAGDIVSARKNLDALYDLLTDVPNLHLAVAGDAADSPYPALAVARGIADRVHFAGYRRDMPDFLACADLFVFLSHYEPFGLVVPQALAVGVPVITTEAVGASALVTPDTGIVLPARPTRAMVAAAVERLLADPATRAVMRAKAAEQARRFSVQRMADRYVDLYEGRTTSEERVALAAAER
jgi:glycosyltransferase involved in cell wall biosynthesis